MTMTFETKDAEIAFWKAAAIYFADCHAATAESITRGGNPNMSLCDRKRFLTIAGICLTVIDSDTIDALRANPETWAFARGFLNADLETERRRVANRSRNALDD
jgi:hypothetical protein